MFERLLAKISGKETKTTDSNPALRRMVYEGELGAVDATFAPPAGDGVEIVAFERDFATGDDEDHGFVLLTNGMSDRRMPLPDAAKSQDAQARAELMWYVREPTPEIVATLRWLAAFPFIDQTWLGFGHRIPMPEPPLSTTAFKTFLLLTPIIGPDQRIAEALSAAGEPVEVLTVNLISDAEYGLIKAEGIDPFLDLLDERDYPPIFDPGRESYVR